MARRTASRRSSLIRHLLPPRWHSLLLSAKSTAPRARMPHPAARRDESLALGRQPALHAPRRRGQRGEQHRDAEAVDQHLAVAERVDVDEGVRVLVHERPAHERVRQPQQREAERGDDGAPVDARSRAERQPPDDRRRRHHVVEHRVGDDRPALVVHDRAQHHEVDRTRDGDAHQRVQPQHAPPPAVARRGRRARVAAATMTSTLLCTVKKLSSRTSRTPRVSSVAVAVSTSWSRRFAVATSARDCVPRPRQRHERTVGGSPRSIAAVDRYGDDVLAGDWKVPVRGRSTEVAADGGSGRGGRRDRLVRSRRPYREGRRRPRRAPGGPAWPRPRVPAGPGLPARRATRSSSPSRCRLRPLRRGPRAPPAAPPRCRGRGRGSLAAHASGSRDATTPSWWRRSGVTTCGSRVWSSRCWTASTTSPPRCATSLPSRAGDWACSSTTSCPARRSRGW